VIQVVLRVLGCPRYLCLQVVLMALLDLNFPEIQEVQEVHCLNLGVQHFQMGQMVLMVQDNLVVQWDRVALVGQLTLVDQAALMDL